MADNSVECIKKGLGFLKQGLKQGKYQDVIYAIYEFTNAINLTKDNETKAMAHIGRGLTYIVLGRYGKAIEDYSKAIELNPKDPEAYINRGNAYADQKKYEEAIKDYSKAIELNPKYADAYNNRGNAYANQKKYDEAIKDYDKAIKLNTKYAYYYYNRRGLAYADQKKYDEAIKDYDEAIKLNPNYADAYINRGYSKKQLEKKYGGDYKEAKEKFKATQIEYPKYKEDEKTKEKLLYKYRPLSKNGQINRDVILELIREAIYFANPDSFNDPFDTPLYNGAIKDVKELKDFLSEDEYPIKICSLSKTKKDSTMFSNYADEHRGICIGYKYSRIKEHADMGYNVDYKDGDNISFSRDAPKSNNSNTISFEDKLFESNKNKQNEDSEKDKSSKRLETFKELIATKLKSWEYEQEYRFATLGDPNQLKYDNGIKEIVFGLRCSEDYIKLIYNLLKNRYIIFYKAKKSTTHLKMDVIRIINTHIYDMDDDNIQALAKRFGIYDFYEMVKNKKTKDD